VGRNATSVIKDATDQRRRCLNASIRARGEISLVAVAADELVTTLLALIYFVIFIVKTSVSDFATFLIVVLRCMSCMVSLAVVSLQM